MTIPMRSDPIFSVPEEQWDQAVTAAQRAQVLVSEEGMRDVGILLGDADECTNTAEATPKNTTTTYEGSAKTTTKNKSTTNERHAKTDELHGKTDEGHAKLDEDEDKLLALLE